MDNPNEKFPTIPPVSFHERIAELKLLKPKNPRKKRLYKSWSFQVTKVKYYTSIAALF